LIQVKYVWCRTLPRGSRRTSFKAYFFSIEIPPLPTVISTVAEFALVVAGLSVTSGSGPESVQVSSAPAVDIDEVDPDVALAAERLEHRAQRRGSASGPSDHPAQVLGVDPHLESLAAVAEAGGAVAVPTAAPTSLAGADAHVVGMVDDPARHLHHQVAQEVVVFVGVGQSVTGALPIMEPVTVALHRFVKVA